MRNFTEKDIKVARIYTDRSELVYAPLDWQLRGLQQTASGYGAKLTTSLKIMFEGKLRRLYSTCYGNSGSVWFKTKGHTIYVD